MNQLLQQPIFQVTVPLMVTFVATVWIAQWSQNKRLEDMREEFRRGMAEVVKRLDRIEHKLDDHDTRITRVEERTSIVRR